jgi:hypothetical protein
MRSAITTGRLDSRSKVNRPSDAPWDRPLHDAAVRKTRGLEAGKRYRAKLAQAEANALKHSLPHGAAAVVKRPGFRADQASLVYLVTHAAYGAAKVGIADTSGSRLAEHRREGWQILAVFQVTAKAAVAIETDILRWWRGVLGLPSYLRRDQMPQGGWTETVAAGRVDLAATVTRICNGGCVAASGACLTRPRTPAPAEARAGVASLREAGSLERRFFAVSAGALAGPTGPRSCRLPGWRRCPADAGGLRDLRGGVPQRRLTSSASTSYTVALLAPPFLALVRALPPVGPGHDRPRAAAPAGVAYRGLLPGGLPLNSGFPDVCVSVSLVFCQVRTNRVCYLRTT